MFLRSSYYLCMLLGARASVPIDHISFAFLFSRQAQPYPSLAWPSLSPAYDFPGACLMGPDIEMSLLGHEISRHCKRSYNLDSNQGKTTSWSFTNMPNNLERAETPSRYWVGIEQAGKL